MTARWQVVLTFAACTSDWLDVDHAAVMHRIIDSNERRYRRTGRLAVGDVDNLGAA